MSTNSTEYMRRWWREWWKHATEQQKADRRRYNSEKARKYYRKNRAKICAKASAKARTGYDRATARNRVERIADGYVKRVLIQRGWSMDEIAFAKSQAGLWACIKQQIRAKREIRKCQSRT